uniref:Holin n=1 Tax=Streptomyces phage Scarif TaxID=3158858 RepID=A0AAU7GYW8_9CAUD
METWLQLALTSLVTLGGSSGIWAYLQFRLQRKDRVRDQTTRLMMGVAYNTITTLGIAYIDRGYVTKDEYEELRKYFFEPYRALGGNGVAERIMNEVSRLPFSSHSRYSEIFRNEGRVSNVRVVTREEQTSVE